MSLTDEKLYSVPQAAEQTHASRPTIWRKLRLGHISRVKIGGKTFIRESELKRLVRETANVR